MPNYEDCVIYTIRSGEGLYVGSTCNFTQRKHDHKSKIYNENKSSYKSKLYKTIRDNDNEWDMQPHKLFPCKNKMEMRIEEERCRNELNADLNSNSCQGQNKEMYKQNALIYAEVHKERIKEVKDKYRQKNSEKYKLYMKNYRDNIENVTCDCGCLVSGRHLKQHQKTKKHLKLLEEKQENIKEVYEIF